MKDTLRAATPIDVEMSGMRVEAHGYIVTPVARMRGRIGSSSDERASGRYGWVEIRPVRMDVVDRDGNMRKVRLVDTQAQFMWALLIAGKLMALLGLLLPVLLSRARRR
jgi:hypothetical protein